MSYFLISSYFPANNVLVPAQAQVAQNGISIVLLKLLETGKLKGSALLGVTYELLEMASEQSMSRLMSYMSRLMTDHTRPIYRYHSR